MLLHFYEQEQAKVLFIVSAGWEDLANFVVTDVTALPFALGYH